jgi:hypothetical protein
MKKGKSFLAAGSLMLTPVLASNTGSGSAGEMAALAAKLLPRTEGGLKISCASAILAGLVDARIGMDGRGRHN